MTLVPQRGWSRNFFVRTRVEPVAPVKPPAALVLLAAGQKCIRTSLVDRASDERSFRVARRIKKALQMTTVRQDKCRILAHDLRRLIHGFPWRYVSGNARDDVAVDLDALHIDSDAVQRKLSRIHERVGEVEVEVVRMQARR